MKELREVGGIILRCGGLTRKQGPRERGNKKAGTKGTSSRPAEDWSQRDSMGSMKKVILLVFLATVPVPSQLRSPRPQAIPLSCAQVDCPMLKGAPQTAGMRSGFVRLNSAQTVGWHTTGQNEEALVILHGKGEALIDGQPGLRFVAPALIYIPPATRHNVENTGSDALEYEYVVAPARTP